MAKGGRWTGAVGSEVAEMARADLLRLRPLESRVRRKLQARFGGRLMEKARKGPRQEPTPPADASVSSDRSAQDRSEAKPEDVAQTPVARLRDRAASRAKNAYAVRAAEIVLTH